MLAVGRGGILRVGHDEKQAHTDFVAALAGLKVNASARDADGAAHVVEMLPLRIRRTNAHELGNFAAAAAAALGRPASGRRILRKLFHLLLSSPVSETVHF